MKMTADEPVTFNPHKANAYSEAVKFDLEPKSLPDSLTSRSVDVKPFAHSNGSSFNPEISIQTSPPKTWEVDVRGLCATKKWLQNYGLKKNRLDMHHLLPQIGFKHSDEYDVGLKKPIRSRYGMKMFHQCFRADGRTYNVACTKEQLKQLEARLTQAIALYKRRLDWLTTESRRIFGVVEEKSAAIVLDIRTLSPQQFDQYRSAVERVIREQVSQLAKFNIIRAAEDVNSYSKECVPVSAESVDGAVQWLWSLDRTSAVSSTATCEAVIQAVNDRNIEAVYLFTEGSAGDGSRELLKEKLTGARVPVHVVSYNCSNPDSVDFLKNLTRITGGRFHAYAVVMEMDSYEGLPLNPDTNQANIVLRKKTYGGVPPGAGIREDVIVLFEELEEARNNLAQIQSLIEEYPENTPMDESKPAVLDSSQKSRTETYMSSREWLDKYGLRPKKLGFYDILAGVAFKHQDGVVDLKCPPRDMHQTDAVCKQKLVNARYCDKFSHVRWKDGQVVHVQVTPEIHRNYELRMSLALEAIQQRIDWLQQGSREIFGTVIEDQIYFLIDTSSSMAPHIQFVKDKLFILMQEQLRHKQKFNIVSFDNRACAWRDRQVDVNEKNLQNAWQWIKMLDCKGSTNTLSALRHALSDPQTQAIYILTDGRPDQPPKSVLAQVQLHPNVPIHTISFNCADKEANEFLCQLAKDTGGRFHYYSEDGIDPEGPEPWESEDIRLLKQEYDTATRNLEKIATLRDECAALAWRKDEIAKKCSRDHPLPEHGRDSAVPPLSSRDLYRNSTDRPQSAPGYNFSPAPPLSRTPRPSTAQPRPSTAHSFRPGMHTGSSVVRRSRRKSPRSNSRSLTIDNRPVKPLNAGIPNTHRYANVAGHTRTSVLRLLGNNGHYDRPEWLLPETRDLFLKQEERQQRILQIEDRKERRRNSRNQKMASSFTMSSKQFLARNGLAARKLTILDALAPTFIPHKTKYVPIIDKEVSSKVYDGIMPIAHTRREGKKVTIVNPLAVNLEDYQKQVENSISKYKKRLNKLVWDALPEDERQQLGGEGPVSYLDNKVAILQALDRCDWPAKEADVILLENEIRQGETYVQQAKDLRDAAEGKSRLPGSARSDGSHGSARSDGSRDGSESETEKADKKKDSEDDPSDHDSNKDDNRSEESVKAPHSEAGDVTPRSARSDQYEGMGEAMEKKVKKQKKGKKSGGSSGITKALDVLRGQRVIGRNEQDGFYYQGSVVRCPDARNALVEFDELGQKKISTRFVIPTGGAIARPVLRAGDYVLGRVINQDTGLQCYVPGVILMTPARQQAQAKFYTVLLYSAQKEHFLRSYLVKISKMRYFFLVRYIRDHSQDEDDTRSRSNSRSSSESRLSSRSRSRSRSSSPALSTNNDDTSSKGKRASPELEKRRLQKWQRHLQRQQRNQRHTQKELTKQSMRLTQIQQKLESHDKDGKKQEQQQLLEMILDELNNRQPEKRESRRPASGRSGSHESQENSKDGSMVAAFAMEMRQSLSGLSPGEEVLARWSDEGWYYRGTVKTDFGDGSYFIQDSVGSLEKIWREDIISESDDAHTVLKVKDTVTALHPDYAFSYAPAVIKSIGEDLWSEVRFYDGTESRVPREEVFHIPTEKFELDVSYILRCEDQWVGQAVVARNDNTGIYHLGAIRERVGNGRQYVVEGSDGKLAVQNSCHIFGAFTRRHQITLGDRVLAVADPELLLYLPGWVSSVRGAAEMDVNFCDGSKVDQVDTSQCFWLSDDYYKTAENYYQTKQGMF